MKNFLYYFLITLLYFIIFICSIFILPLQPIKEYENYTTPFHKNIYFVAANNSDGTIMRAKQISDKLGTKGFKATTIFLKDVKKYYNVQNSIFVWLGAIGNDHIPHFLHQQFHVLDIIDHYIYEKKNEVDYGIKKKLYNALFVNNEAMKNFFKNKTKAEIYVIHHHYDPRYENITTMTEENSLTFGYSGSILSLFHSDNFLYFQKLAKEYNILFFDTEYGLDVTPYIHSYERLYHYLKSKPKYVKDNLPKNVQYNCDISIRPYGSDVCKFKTTAKIATAAILGHNIITTYDDSVKDVLSPDYPFLLKSTDYESVKSMFDKVIKDFNTDKMFWKKGLRLMEEVKRHLNLNKIVKIYMNALKLNNFSMYELEEKVMGVYHIGCVGTRYIDIVTEQLHMLKKSKLYIIMKKLVLFISNYDEKRDKKLLLFLKKYDTKKKLILHISKENKMEKFAINTFRDYIDNEKYVFYFHSKGVSHNKNFYIENWRKILDYYTLEKWLISVNLLQKYDAVGAFLSFYPSIHFSGNFWWATTNYLNKLPKHCGNYYLSPEMWIGYGRGNLISLSNDFRYTFHYHQSRSDEEIYKNLTDSFIVYEKNKCLKH